jgi:hypothetical protein
MPSNITSTLQRLVTFAAGFLVLLVSTAHGQCPAVGADTTCGIVITVNQTGNAPCPPQGCAAITFTGQGPYDEIEDTLVGVVNHSNLPISSLILQSSTDAFGFDGDGICGISPNTGVPFVPAPPGCPFGPTTYEGPGVSFTNLSADRRTGTVNFNPPIPVGGSAYFSLEESLAAATACSTIINNSVPKPAGGSPTISATFTPKNGFTLAQAAQLCGFTGWDWQQTVTSLPLPNPFKQIGTPPKQLSAPPPFLDPPPGGYTYNLPGGDHSYPFYYDPNSGELASHETATTLNFADTPADNCLHGGTGASCGGMTAPAGKILGFTTHLVGLVGAGPGFGVQDTGIGFSWTSDFNGTSGGISVTKNNNPADPGSGTGGVTITGYSPTTTYQFPKGIGVIGINGAAISPPTSSLALLAAGQIATTASGLVYSRVTQTFNATVNITNTSGSSISGPFQIVFDSLTAGVTVVNATGTFGGWPFVTVPNVSSLAPGQSASVAVQFRDPTNAPISFSPVPYTGSFN